MSSSVDCFWKKETTNNKTSLPMFLIVSGWKYHCNHNNNNNKTSLPMGVTTPYHNV